MNQEKQGPSATVRDITEPGWREREAERDRAMVSATGVIRPLQSRRIQAT
jgi:hypothetical protein